MARAVSVTVIAALMERMKQQEHVKHVWLSPDALPDVVIMGDVLPEEDDPPTGS
jgi:hypothetical protein